jgi:hypothetical protein
MFHEQSNSDLREKYGHSNLIQTQLTVVATCLLGAIFLDVSETTPQVQSSDEE